jgi:hypothetical protein
VKSAARKLGEDPTLWFFATLAVLLVLFRSIVPAWYEGFDFDSDQAIVGLMAKHLAQGRTFPLFFYGQNYMLGVQAWIATPLFFVIGHPSVFLLRLPLVAVNAGVAVALIVGLARGVQMRPSLAFVAALPFVLPTPIVGSRLLQTLGASVEPFLYVLVLWTLRARPFLFGAVLGVGFLHREFTIFAVPALLIVEALEGSLMTRAALGRLVRIAISFGIVWGIVDVLKRHLTGSGPAAGAMHGAPLTLQMQTVMGKLCLAPHEVMSRLDSFVVDCFPDLFGTRRVPMNALGLNSTMTTGSIVLAWTLGITALIMVASPGKARPRQPLGICWYLGLIGVQAVLAYPLSCEIVPGVPGVLRYALLALLVPIAGFAWYVTREHSRGIIAAVVCGFLLCAAINLRDHANLLYEYRTHPPPNKFRRLSDYLVAHHIQYARAAYWDSYILDFMSDEQAIVASMGKVRVAEYQQRVDEHEHIAVQIQREPCSGDVRFEAWCLSGPLQGGQK